MGFGVLILFGAVEILYLHETKSMKPLERVLKKQFVTLSTLPDLAIATEATFVRHRSLSTLFEVYREGGGLICYFPTTYAYWYAPTLNQTPSKVIQ
ncbi:MAG: hypothetical protein KU38_02210 [Sulfurovum sp. FS08-3]|nr:MAG: hypothetical protein KU38_02210 [Sulfurovum sp. FS08-3]